MRGRHDFVGVLNSFVPTMGFVVLVFIFLVTIINASYISNGIIVLAIIPATLATLVLIYRRYFYTISHLVLYTFFLLLIPFTSCFYSAILSGNRWVVDGQKYSGDTEVIFASPFGSSVQAIPKEYRVSGSLVASSKDGKQVSVSYSSTFLSINDRETQLNIARKFTTPRTSITNGLKSAMFRSVAEQVAQRTFEELREPANWFSSVVVSDQELRHFGVRPKLGFRITDVYENSIQQGR